jgi:ketosteroid isomerase-like protein
MKRLIVVLIAGIAATAVGSARSEEQPNTRAEREIRALEAQFGQAVVAGDRAFYQRVLAPDFTHTSHAGKFKTRAQFLAENKFENPQQKVAAPKTTYEALDVDDLEVRIYGETAVVTGRTTPKGRTAQGTPMRGQYRFLRVWVQRDGQWQIVAFQGTRIAEP